MKNRSWKTAIIAIFALAGVAFTVAPTTAEAGHSSNSSRYSHRCSSCNGPVYQRLAVVGYTHCGDPIYRWVSVTHRCSHSSHSSHGSYGSHSRGYSSRPIQPHDIISGIVSGIINSHHSHRSSHSCR